MSEIRYENAPEMIMMGIVISILDNSQKGVRIA